MKKVTIMLNNEKEIVENLDSDLTADEFVKKLNEGKRESKSLIFNTETGCIVIPISIWENCIITLS